MVVADPDIVVPVNIIAPAQKSPAGQVDGEKCLFMRNHVDNFDMANEQKGNGSGLAGGKERRLTLDRRDNDMTLANTCLCGS